MAFIIPTVADFKAQFTRDFPYGTTPDVVNDSDIQRGISTAGFNFNSGLCADQAQFSLLYLLLSAHYLVTNLRTSSQGIAGQYAWLQSSKGVGSVSTGLAIPDRILSNPFLAMLTKTNYGAQYLELVLPQIIGEMFTVCGGTHP